jgi:hypothetical protein
LIVGAAIAPIWTNRGVVVRGGMAAAQRGEYLLGGLTPQIVEDGVEWALGMGDGDTGTKSSSPIVMASSAPTLRNHRSRSVFRPATTTCWAPNTDFASYTATEPVTPVAPSTSTCAPGLTAAA